MSYKKIKGKWWRRDGWVSSLELAEKSTTRNRARGRDTIIERGWDRGFQQLGFNTLSRKASR